MAVGKEAQAFRHPQQPPNPRPLLPNPAPHSCYARTQTVYTIDVADLRYLQQPSDSRPRCPKENSTAALLDLLKTPTGYKTLEDCIHYATVQDAITQLSFDFGTGFTSIDPAWNIYISYDTPRSKDLDEHPTQLRGVNCNVRDLADDNKDSCHPRVLKRIRQFKIESQPQTSTNNAEAQIVRPSPENAQSRQIQPWQRESKYPVELAQILYSVVPTLPNLVI
ncbi:hypothetical protein MBLNU230_g1578t1 [Neophaeotheca triangularis]